MEYAVPLAAHLRREGDDADDGDDREKRLADADGAEREYYRALKMLKKETLLVRMPDEFRELARPRIGCCSSSTCSPGSTNTSGPRPNPRRRRRLALMRRVPR